MVIYGAYTVLANLYHWYLQGLTMAMMWSAACVTSKRLAPKGLEATMQASSKEEFSSVALVFQQ